MFNCLNKIYKFNQQNYKVQSGNVRLLFEQWWKQASEIQANQTKTHCTVLHITKKYIHQREESVVTPVGIQQFQENQEHNSKNENTIYKNA